VSVAAQAQAAAIKLQGKRKMQRIPLKKTIVCEIGAHSGVARRTETAASARQARRALGASHDQ
jgi:hypothetical protein